MKNIVSIDKYLDYLEENHKRLIQYFDELYKEYAQYESFKSDKVNRRQRKKLEEDRKEAFTVFYANLRYLIKGEDVRLDFVEKKENSVKRFFKRLFKIKDKEIPVLVIEESSTDNEQLEDIPAKDEIISEITSKLEEENAVNSNEDETNEEPNEEKN